MSQTSLTLVLAKVDKHHLGRLHRLLGIEIELVEHIEDAVGSERDAYPRHTRQAEYAREVVVTAATRDAAYLHVERLDFEYGAGIVVEATGQSQIDFERRAQGRGRELLQNILQLVDAFDTRLRTGQFATQHLQLLLVAALQLNDGLQTGHSLLGQSFLEQLGIHLVETYLVELVDGDGNVDNFLGSPYPLGNTAQYLAVVQFDGYPYAQTGKHLVDHLDKFHLVQQRVGTHHIGIALVELAVTSLLRTVGPPHGLYLITLEGEGEFVAVHHHKAGKRHREVIAQTLLAQAGSQPVEVPLGQVGLRHV